MAGFCDSVWLDQRHERDLRGPGKVGFSDIVENLEIGALVHVEARRQRWSVLFGGIFLAVGEGIPNPPGAVDVDQVIAEVGAWR